jgi:hypothetical protein
MTRIGSTQQGTRNRKIKGVLIGLATACLLAGCTAAETPSVPATSAPTASSPAESPSVQATPPATPISTPTPTTGPATLPAGTWTGIKWVSAGAAFPQTPVAGTGEFSETTVGVFGWSRGYVGFRTASDQSSPQTVSFKLVSTTSSDGLHWTAGKAMDVSGLPFAVVVTAVVEGPAGLLAVGESQDKATCGGPPTVAATWTSTDGVAWALVKPPADFASASVYTVDAGSTGYVATGLLKDGATHAVWLSGDGRSWHQAPLPKATFGKVVVDGATDFAAGYVVSGAVLGPEGCGGSSLLTPSLWWSADGQSWTRSKLAGATPSSEATMTVSRISDHVLMAIASEWNATTQATTQVVWVTTDGRTWSLVKAPSNLLSANVMTNGQRALLFVEPTGINGPPTIATVADDLTVATLTQTGDGPMASADSVGWAPAAFGPAGLVVLSSDGLDLWLGVPAAS